LKEPNVTHCGVTIQWTEVAPAPVGHSGHTAVLLDGKVYIGGGDSSPKVPIYCIDVYNVAENMWSSQILTSCCYFSLALLSNNLIVAGGRDRARRASREMLRLDDNQLKRYNTMSKPRYTRNILITTYQYRVSKKLRLTVSFALLRCTAIYVCIRVSCYLLKDQPRCCS